MFQFRRFPTYAYGFNIRYAGMTPRGFPHSEMYGSPIICISPYLFAAYHVFLRLSVPRHPPCALSCLTCSKSASQINYRGYFVTSGMFYFLQSFLWLLWLFRSLLNCCAAFGMFYIPQSFLTVLDGLLYSVIINRPLPFWDLYWYCLCCTVPLSQGVSPLLRHSPRMSIFVVSCCATNYGYLFSVLQYSVFKVRSNNNSE